MKDNIQRALEEIKIIIVIYEVDINSTLKYKLFMCQLNSVHKSIKALGHDVSIDQYTVTEDHAEEMKFWVWVLSDLRRQLQAVYERM